MLRSSGSLRSPSSSVRCQVRAAERIDTEVAVEAANECRRTVDAARKLAGKVWAEPDRWTHNALYRDMRRHRDVLTTPRTRR